MNPSAGFNLDTGIFDVGDWQPADGTGLNEDKCLLRHTRFVKGPPARSRAEPMGFGLYLSQESRQIVSPKRNGSQELFVHGLRFDFRDEFREMCCENRDD
jgi:hypothetical protein